MRTLLVGAIAVGGLLLAAGNAGATPSSCDASAGNLVANCGFEANTGNYPNNWTTDAGYDAYAGLWNYIIDTPGFCHSGNNCLQIGNYSYEGYAGISQDISTTAGNSYSESFWYKNTSPGGSGESLEALVDGTVKFSTDGSTDTGNWQEVAFHFTAANAMTDIGFKAYNDGSEFYLDDIVVHAGGLGVPEPTTLSILGAGLVAAAARRRRRRAIS
jgi:hypothetical protein